MNHEALTVKALLDTSHTLAADLLAGVQYPWEILPRLRSYIEAMGSQLPRAEYVEEAPGVWIARDAIVAGSVSIAGPCIIGHEAEIRHCAFIRGSVLVGKCAVVGNSTELKNALLFDEVQVPHYNYVGDSVLGFRSHMGAGAITSNVKSDKGLVTVVHGDARIETGLKKFGAVLGDDVEIGCNSVLCPGAVIGRGSIVYPLSRVRGSVPQEHIFKDEHTVVARRQA